MIARTSLRGTSIVLFLLLLTACGQPAPTETFPAAVATPELIQPSDSWIEVDLVRQVVVLHEQSKVVAEYAASSGLSTDARYATPPGLYRVQSKEKGPIESVPGVFVSDVIMFDLGRGNGFHSRPMDADGQLLDATLGQTSTAGCVRVGESARLYEFAQVGMRVWIH